jgi:catechol 2,3-dioxygenase-like lactoylglutathione lyase family enzyme
MRLIGVVFEAVNPESLEDSWRCEVDRWVRRRGIEGERHLVPDEQDEGTLELVFSPASKRQKVGKNRIHLDLNTFDDYDYQRLRAASIECAEYTGVRQVDVGQGELVPWTVFADPEGNEFCLLKPRDRYKRSGKLAAVVIDCADPGRLATFWSAATGWRIVDNEPGFAALRRPDLDEGPFIEFLRVDDRSPEPSPVSLGFESYWPHQHDAEVAGLVDLGARKVRKHEGEVSYTIVADPEGNEFRVFVPVWPPPPPPPRRFGSW